VVSPLPYADKLDEFFYEGLGRQTSACLYGSAATENWVPGRSDLDLVILVPEEKLEPDLVGQLVGSNADALKGKCL
jgi:predicted nucleotidyltransferase